MQFNLRAAIAAGRQALFAEAEKPAAELGEVAYADILKRLYGDPKKAFPVYQPNEVAGKKGIRYYTKMARDDQIKSALALKRYAVMAGGWTVNSPKGEPKDWEPTAFITECFTELGSTVEGAADGVLSKYAYGFSLTEKVWAERDGMIVLADMKTRHPYGIEFEQDAYGNILEIKQGWGALAGGMPLPAEKFLLCVHDGQFSNPYGQSDLESAYRPWWIKENSYKWMAMLLEKMGIPPIFVGYDSNMIKGQLLDDLKSIISNLQAATTAAIPRGNSKESIDFWAPEIAGNVASVFQPAIKMLNEDIARSILMPSLMGLTPDSNTGSQARSNVHFDVFMLVIERERKYLEMMMNRRVVRDMVDFNFSGLGNNRPYFQLLPLSTDKQAELFKVWSEMVSKGTVSKQVEDEKYLRESLRMPEMTDETMERRREQLEAGDPLAGIGPAMGDDSPDDKGSKSGKRDSDPDGENPDADTYAARRSPEEKARRDMDRIETALLSDVRATLTGTRDVLVDAIRRQGAATVKFAESIQLRKLGDVQSSLEEGLRGAFSAGAGALTYEVRGTLQRDYMTPRAAVSYIKQKSVEITGVMRDDLTQKAKMLILDAVKNGEALEVTIEKAIQLFGPYLGAEDGVQEDVLKPYRLETILRTNITDAYNQGRLSTMQDPDVLPYIVGVEYSSILDTRTTEVCQFLHGKIFKPNDPELLRLTPPNHFNALAGGTLIETSRGQVPIEKIKSGDFVLTHRGRYRPVYATMNKEIDKPFIKRLSLSSGAELLLTDDHPVLTSSGWKIAGDLKLGDVVFDRREKMGWIEDIRLPDPKQFPSLFDQPIVSYQVTSFSIEAFMGLPVKLDCDMMFDESEIENIAASAELILECNSAIGQYPEHDGLMERPLSFESSGKRNVPLFENPNNSHGVIRGHSDRCVLALDSIRPMILTGSLGDNFGGTIGNRDLIKSGSYLDPVPLAPRAESSLPESMLTLNSANGFTASEMFRSDKHFNGVFIGQVDDHINPHWSGTAIISIADVNYTDKVYNLAVRDDESYHANGIIVHNCRSILIPITKAMAKKRPIPADGFITRTQEGRAADLAGKGFYSLLKPVCGGDALDHLRRYADDLGYEMGDAE